MTSKVKPVIFNNAKITKGGVCAAKGFKASGIDAGISKDAKRDLAIIACENKCNTAAVFTTNQVKAAPVVLSAGNVANGTAQAVVVNSGNANACTDFGMTDAEVMRDATAQALGIAKEDVIVASTGVIGQELPIEPIKTAIPALTAALSETGSAEAAEAIMTTDTFAKEFAVSYELTDGKVFNVGGIAKGSGMINPNMATMLCFITTDINISSAMLDKALREYNAFNMVCVDGDTSTNDMVSIMASGAAGNDEITDECEDYKRFESALMTVTENLARAIARDGEGATKLIGCNVTRAADEATAKAIAKSVISSSLVKAAFSAADANWGRILCAMGYAGVAFDVNKVEVVLHSVKGMVTVCKHGKAVEFSEDKATEILSEDEVMIFIYLYSGDYGAIAWGCDLTAEYVRINADYRS